MRRQRLHEKKKLDRDDQCALTLAWNADTSEAPVDELTDRLKNLLIFEEGRVILRNGLHVAYKDSKGISTIGYGFNLQDGSSANVLRRVTEKPVAALIAKTEFLTEREAQQLLLIAEVIALKGVRSYFPAFASIELPRQVVLAAMVYQMGAGGFGRFGRLIAGAKAHDWGTVVASMQESQWYRSDSPQRAKRMVAAIQSDTFPASAVRSPPGQQFTAVPLLGDEAGSASEEPARPRSPWPFDNG